MYHLKSGVGCPYPPFPNQEHLIHASETNGAIIGWSPGEIVEPDNYVSYICVGGRKFDVDVLKESEDVYCRSENVWDIPSPWPNCIESK